MQRQLAPTHALLWIWFRRHRPRIGSSNLLHRRLAPCILRLRLSTHEHPLGSVGDRTGRAGKHHPSGLSCPEDSAYSEQANPRGNTSSRPGEDSDRCGTSRPQQKGVPSPAPIPVSSMSRTGQDVHSNVAQQNRVAVAPMPSVQQANPAQTTVPAKPMTTPPTASGRAPSLAPSFVSKPEPTSTSQAASPQAQAGSRPWLCRAPAHHSRHQRESQLVPRLPLMCSK